MPTLKTANKKIPRNVWLTPEAYKRLQEAAIQTRSRSISDLVERLSEGDPRVLRVVSQFFDA